MKTWQFWVALSVILLIFIPAFVYAGDASKNLGINQTNK